MIFLRGPLSSPDLEAYSTAPVFGRDSFGGGRLWPTKSLKPSSSASSGSKIRQPRSNPHAPAERDGFPLAWRAQPWRASRRRCRGRRNPPRKRRRASLPRRRRPLPSATALIRPHRPLFRAEARWIVKTGGVFEPEARWKLAGGVSHRNRQPKWPSPGRGGGNSTAPARAGAFFFARSGG